MNDGNLSPFFRGVNPIVIPIVGAFDNRGNAIQGVPVVTQNSKTTRINSWWEWWEWWDSRGSRGDLLAVGIHHGNHGNSLTGDSRGSRGGFEGLYGYGEDEGHGASHIVTPLAIPR